MPPGFGTAAAMAAAAMSRIGAIPIALRMRFFLARARSMSPPRFVRHGRSIPVEMPADRRPQPLRRAEDSRSGGIIPPTMRALAIVVPAFLLLASTPARPDDRLANAGKQRAAASRLAWEIREAGHPLLGPI